MCLSSVQNCDNAIEHGGGPADKVKLNVALTRVKKMTSSSYVKRRHGVGAVGYAVVQPDQRIPDNDFFEPQRTFRVRFRSVNFSIMRYVSKLCLRNFPLYNFQTLTDFQQHFFIAWKGIKFTKKHL